MEKISAKRKRKIYDGSIKTMIYFVNIFLVGSIIWIVAFVFQQGSQVLSFDFLLGDYQSRSGWVSVEVPSNRPLTSENSLCSQRFLVCFEEHLYQDGNVSNISVDSIEDTSPWIEGKSSSDGIEITSETFVFLPSMTVKSIRYRNENGRTKYGGLTYGDTGEELVNLLDNEVYSDLYVEYEILGGGIRSSILATFYLILFSLLFSLPLGIMTALFLNEYAPQNSLVKWIQMTIDTLAGIPSIVFGFVGAAVFLTLFSGLTNGIRAYSVFAGAMTMTMIILPIVTRTTIESLRTIPQSYRDASLALGATRTQTTFRIVLPNALSGIINSAMLSIARIVGESAALMGVMGLIINDHFQLVGSNTESTTLATHIFVVMGGESPDIKTACGIALLILIIVLILNFLVKIVDGHFRKRSMNGGKQS